MGQRIVTSGLWLAGSAAVAAVLAGATIGLGLRYRLPVVLDGLRRFSRSAINPGQMATAGQPGAYASIIEHTGRVSGRTHQTPIVARAVEDGWVVSLTYGQRADWVRNVLAAGTATLITEGTTHADLQAEVVPLTEAGEWTSATERRLLRWFGIDTCLRLTRRR